jgi:hypothetical protein
MQARNPCELFCLQKAWQAQFLRKEPRIVCAATRKCQARISFALLSISTEQ